ncbi:MAG: F0F1 ATP synthase subunit B [Patescibacteria group bacterium]
MEQLGIQPMLLLAQIVNFTIVVWVLNRLLYKPIIKFLDKRRAEIAEGIKQAQEMREEEEKIQEKREKILDTARREAQRLINQAKEQAKEKEREIIASAHTQAQEIIKRGKSEVGELRKTLEKELRAHAVDVALMLIKRSIPTLMTSQDQHKLLLKQLKDLETGSFRN